MHNNNWRKNTPRIALLFILLVLTHTEEYCYHCFKSMAAQEVFSSQLQKLKQVLTPYSAVSVAIDDVVIFSYLKKQQTVHCKKKSKFRSRKYSIIMFVPSSLPVVVCKSLLLVLILVLVLALIADYTEDCRVLVNDALVLGVNKGSTSTCLCITGGRYCSTCTSLCCTGGR